MSSQIHISKSIPERFLEVDAARLLIILFRFSEEITEEISGLSCFPSRPVVRYFTPEYYLQKLDFLLRNPGYFIYELIEAWMKTNQEFLLNCQLELLETIDRTFHDGH